MSSRSPERPEPTTEVSALRAEHARSHAYNRRQFDELHGRLDALTPQQGSRAQQNAKQMSPSEINKLVNSPNFKIRLGPDVIASEEVLAFLRSKTVWCTPGLERVYCRDISNVRLSRSQLAAQHAECALD